AARPPSTHVAPRSASELVARAGIASIAGSFTRGTLSGARPPIEPKLSLRSRRACILRAMSYRGESWEQIVARAASSAPAARSVIEREDPTELASRAQEWTFKAPRFEVAGSKIVLGTEMDSVELAFA